MAESHGGHWITSDHGEMVWCESCGELHDPAALRRGEYGAIEEEAVVEEDPRDRRLNEVWRYIGDELDHETQLVHRYLFDRGREASLVYGGSFSGVLKLITAGDVIARTVADLGLARTTALERISKIFVAMKPRLDQDEHENIDDIIAFLGR